jgi:hypothetical protein
MHNNPLQSPSQLKLSKDKMLKVARIGEETKIVKGYEGYIV